MRGEEIAAHNRSMRGGWKRGRAGAGAVVVTATTLIALAGCGLGSTERGAAPSVNASVVATLRVTSTAFRDGATIPASFTCDAKGGADTAPSPALAWIGAPATAQAMAIVVVDPDANNFVHWLAANVSPGSGGSGFLAQGASGTEAAGVEGRTSAGTNGWTPPCPPKGDGKHRYEVTVYGLSGPLSVEAGFSLSDLRAAMDGKVVATGTIIGLYARAG